MKRSAWLIMLGFLMEASIVRGQIGVEVAVDRHLQDDEEFATSVAELLLHGERLFTANWTWQEGGGRPLSKGTGGPLADPTDPLVFPRNFNRVSAPDANSCAGCHNAPFGIAGGGGDIVANVFVLGQRFDFATFGTEDDILTKSSLDERGDAIKLDTVANSRATLGMFGSGFVEMLARQITADLKSIRDWTLPGQSRHLISKGISFGSLGREFDGSWDTSRVIGIPASSLVSQGFAVPPSLTIKPFHQAGRVVSLREFTNNAFNHHHGIQTTERFGVHFDPDGDGFSDEMTRADVTAVSVFQATMAVPGRLIPNNSEVEEAVLMGEAKFEEVGCTDCHIPSLPLENTDWIFTEPNPYNPPGNLRPGEASEYSVDLTSDELPMPRLKPETDSVVYVPAFTDFKLHDITIGPDDPNREPLDMQHEAGTDDFFSGNGKFLTRKLWDVGNKPNHFHHGKYTTLRESVEAHAGEAQASRDAYGALGPYEQSCIIEFLKSLQVLPPGTRSTVIDEEGNPKIWPPNRLTSIRREGDTVSLTWQGVTVLGRPRLYQLQRCSGIDEPWEDVGEPTLASHAIDPTTGQSEFYRVVVLER